jgi:hypothetical protein
MRKIKQGMTDEEVEERLREAACRLAAPFFGHGIPAGPSINQCEFSFECLLLWDKGYAPARKLLVDEGVSAPKLEAQMAKVKAQLGIVEPSDLIVFPPTCRQN